MHTADIGLSILLAIGLAMVASALAAASLHHRANRPRRRPPLLPLNPRLLRKL